MKFDKLIGKIENYEQESELIECVYLEAVKKLEHVRRNLRTLNEWHIRRIIKPFLKEWGKMGRIVGGDFDWSEFGTKLRSLEPEFKKLRRKKLLTTEFEQVEIAEAIKNIYNKLDEIRYTKAKRKSPTAISKVMHILHPDLFAMWDCNIRVGYRRDTKNKGIRESAEGYVEFLKEVKKQLEEAFNDYQERTGRNWDQIENELRTKFKNKTLVKLADEYNWMVYSS